MRWLDGIIASIDMSLSKLWQIYRVGRGSLVCCSPWSHKELDTTEQLNNNKNIYPGFYLLLYDMNAFIYFFYFNFPFFLLFFNFTILY